MASDAMQRADELLRRMTIEEKAFQLTAVMPMGLMGSNGPMVSELERQIGHGIGQMSAAGQFGGSSPAHLARTINSMQRFLIERTRLGIPAIFHNDALNGLMAPQYTVFPTAIGLAATWNADAVQEMATTTRRQMRSVGLRQALAPVMDVARWGRAHETYGEDPYLLSAMSVAYTRGLQGQDLREGVLATAKHFLGYAVTEPGQNLAATQVGRRELYEVSARPFEAAMKLAGLAGGLDVELPVPAGYGLVLADAVQKGLIPETLLDESARRVLRDTFALGLFDHPYVPEDDPIALNDLASDGKELALQLARESVTLLKNDGLLPLSKEIRKIAILGPHGDSAFVGFPGYTYPASVQIMRARMSGGGVQMADLDGADFPISPEARMFLAGVFGPVLRTDPETLVHQMYGSESLAEAVRRLLPDAQVTAVRGTEVLDQEPAGIASAVEAARDADVVILAIGGQNGWFTGQGTEGEGSDTANIELSTSQVALVNAVAQTGVPLVGVMFSGRPLALTPVIDKLSAVVYGYYGGQAAGPALAEVLYGHVNPSGKLPYSLPRHSGQIPISVGQKNGSGYRRTAEDIQKGYLAMPATPLFAFGHGLSSTHFAYTHLVLRSHEVPSNGKISVSAQITNTGTIAGDEVVQLSFSDTATGGTRPAQELVGFACVHLEAGASAEVTFAVAMSQPGSIGFDGTFQLEPGPIHVQMGAASDDIHLEDRFEVIGARMELAGKRSYLSSVTVQLV